MGYMFIIQAVLFLAAFVFWIASLVVGQDNNIRRMMLRDKLFKIAFGCIIAWGLTLIV
jgi:uncharacterized membrane protein YccC